MEACLYDPDGGFYAKAEHPAGTSEGTHFATSPSLHPFFGGAVAREVAGAWRANGAPKTWRVAEFGGATGTLANAATKFLEDADPDAAAAVRWTIVEQGPWAKQARAKQFHMVVANEFLDALPVAWLESDGKSWLEICVGHNGAGWAPTLQAAGADATKAAAGVLVAPKGRRRIFPVGVRPFLAATSKAGACSLLLIDYGERGPATDVRGFRHHAPASPFDEPGTVDITADVDFAALTDDARGAGFEPAGFETQEEFLLRHGVLDALNAQDRSTVEGASAYLRLRQLLLPTGFGAAFKVARFDKP